MSNETVPAIASSDENRTLRVIGRCEWLACAIVVAGLVALRVNFVLHEGGLWRDEVHSVVVAGNPLCPLWQDSFPVLWIAFLRMWLAVCGSSDDTSARLAGLFCSLLVLGAAVWAPQGRSRAIPWVSLVLLGMSPVLTTWGTEVRGYALGVATELWMFGALQRWLVRPTRRSAINLVIASLFAVQAVYANSFLLLAASLSGGLVCLMRKRWLALLGLTANGVLAAVTVSPYILVLLPKATSEWALIIRRESPMSWYILKTMETLGSGGWLPGFAWYLVGGIAAYVAFKEFFPAETLESSNTTGHREWNRMFEPLLFLFGTILILVYLKWLKVPTQDWYYLPVLGLWAFCFDSMIATWPKRPGVSALKLIVALFFAAIQIPAAWNAANVRMTNVDLLVKSIAAVATKDDLIVVKPWYFGITLQRYYRGEAPWVCVPNVESTKVSGVLIGDGYRAVKLAMMKQAPIAAELALIRKTLRQGNRVFVLGYLKLLQPGEQLLQLPTAPNSEYGWSEGAYEWVWMQELSSELQSNSADISRLAVNVQNPVNPFENCPLYQITGRKDPATEQNIP